MYLPYNHIDRQIITRMVQKTIGKLMLWHDLHLKRFVNQKNRNYARLQINARKIVPSGGTSHSPIKLLGRKKWGGFLK